MTVKRLFQLVPLALLCCGANNVLMGCINKSKVSLKQSDSVVYSEDVAEILDLDSDLLDEVVSESNLALMLGDRVDVSDTISLNALLRSDWKSRLPLKLKSGLVKTFEGLEESDEIVGLGDVMVSQFRPSVVHSKHLKRIEKLQKRPLLQFDLAKVELKNSSGLNLAERLSRLNRTPGVLFVEPNISLRTVAQPNDPRWPEQWGLASANLPWVWAKASPKTQALVAIIDTGVDINHTDLKSNVWINDGEIPNNGIDDDLNGYIDDVHGWNFFDNNNDVLDRHGHGTLCAGIAGAIGNNEVGIAGARWNGKLMAVKSFSDTGVGRMGATYEGLLYAISNGARVLSSSFGSPSASALMANAMELASASGVLVVAAAGNEASPAALYPAKYTKDFGQILSVASVDKNLSLSSFSNFNDGVDLAAPGSSILSALPENKFGFMSGTSMATPLVAGVASLLWDHFPKASALDLQSAILRGASALRSLEGKIAGGRVVNAQSAYLALSEALNLPDVPVLRGLQFQLFSGKWKSSAKLEGVNPTLIGSMGRISTRIKSSGKNFAVVYDSYLKLTSDGQYSFYPSSSGKVELFIDGKEVQLKPSSGKKNSELVGQAKLSAGFKKFKLVFINSDQKKSIKLLWSGPQIQKQNINKSSVLFY